VSGLATVALVGALGLWSPAGAAEFHFVVQDLGEKRALWVPQEVVIHRGTEMQDGLVFVLENPTDRTHAFAAYGLFEEGMSAGGELTRKPLRVNVTADDTVRIQISTAQFERRTDETREEFPFFCPLHKGDAHLGGTIRVVP
jgi:cation transport regulator ChaC